MADYDDLKRILGDVVSLDADLHPSMLTTTFDNGVRLSFGCGDDGRLNMVVIQDPLRKSTEVYMDAKKGFKHREVWGQNDPPRAIAERPGAGVCRGCGGNFSHALTNGRCDECAVTPPPGARG
jgi:hypothetical protein